MPELEYELKIGDVIGFGVDLARAHTIQNKCVFLKIHRLLSPIVAYIDISDDQEQDNSKFFVGPMMTCIYIFISQRCPPQAMSSLQEQISFLYKE